MQKSVKVAQLVADYNLYPRHEVDGMQVAHLVEALAAGETLPPMVVEAKSLRVVDGFHRLAAYTRRRTEDVEVEIRQYRSEQELFLDAVRLNARHGVPLSPQDQARALILADEFAISREMLAKALAVRIEKLDAIVRRKLGETRRGGHLYLKPALRHLAGQEISRQVQDANVLLAGNTAPFLIRQLLALIESGGLLLDEETQRLLDQLAVAIAAMKTTA